MHRTLTEPLAVLRREPRPEDALPSGLEFAGDFHKVSPSTARLIAVARGTRFWALGATFGLDRMHARCRRRLPPAARRREARWFRRMKARPLRLAVVHDHPEGGSGGGFFGEHGTAADLYAGRMSTTTGAGPAEESEVVTTVAMVPDGVASVALTFSMRDGGERHHEVPVTDNAWVLEMPFYDDIRRRERMTWRDAEGGEIKSFGPAG